MGSVWIPVVENKQEKGDSQAALNDPSIKEIDLSQISEKEVFVRKADLVISLLSHFCRMTSSRV